MNSIQTLSIFVFFAAIIGTCNSFSISKRLVEIKENRISNIETSRATDTESNRVKRDVEFNEILYIVCTETEACVKLNRTGDYLHPECGQHLNKSYREACFQCRHVYKVCESSRYVHTIF